MTISDKNTRYPLTISKDLKSNLQDIAGEQNRSLNNLMITVLQDFVDEYNKTNEHNIDNKHQNKHL